MKSSVEYSTQDWIDFYEKQLTELRKWITENYCDLPRVVQDVISSGMVRYQELIKELERRG